MATDAPVLDAFVLLNLGIAHPRQYHTPQRRLAEWTRIHSAVTARFSAFLASPVGDRLVAALEASYPAAGISRTKMLDFVLSQLRE